MKYSRYKVWKGFYNFPREVKKILVHISYIVQGRGYRLLSKAVVFGKPIDH